MAVKQEKVIDIEIEDVVAIDRQVNRKLLFIVLALLIAVVVAAIGYGFVRMYRVQQELTDIANEQSEKISDLEQQVGEQKNALASIKQQNDTLASENADLADENALLVKQNDAYKSQISKYNLQYPPEAYIGKKLVALTFDDGPGEYTAELLDFLKEKKVRATFFLLGVNAQQYPALIKRMEKEGHTIGNHSYSHTNLSKLSASKVAGELEKCNAVIRKAVGHNAVVMRCPGGNNNATVKKAAKNAQMPIIHWSVDTRDWELKDKDKILKRAFGEGGITDGSIVLLHDIHRASVDAAKEMILRLKKEGYTFVTVPELLSARAGGMTAGEFYKDAPPTK